MFRALVLGSPDAPDPWRRCLLAAAAGQLLLLAAGLRHNLVWGESASWPWLLPLLNAGEAGCLLGFVALAGWAWWRAMQLAASPDASLSAAGSPENGRRLTTITMWLVLLAVLVPPFATTDPIDYVMRGRILAVHGANPYVQVATDFPGDPFVAFGDAGWKSFPLPYGPLVAWLQGGVAWLASCLSLPKHAELVVAIGLFKLVFAMALLVTARCLQAVADWLPGRRGNVVFVGVLWNPLLLFEGVANAHNEPLLAACLAVTALAWVLGHHGRATFALGIGTLVKVVPIVLAPLAVVVALRQRALGKLAAGVAATLAIAAVCWWQFFRDEGAFAVAARQTQLQGGGLYQILQQVTGVPATTWLVPGRCVVVAWLGFVAWRLWRQPRPRELLFAAASTLFALAAFGAMLSGPWYHVWWIPLALVLGRGWLFRAACAASVLAPLGYLVWCGWRRLDEPAAWCGTTFSWVLPVLVASVTRFVGATPPSELAESLGD
jgi:hypothetical protein